VRSLFAPMEDLNNQGFVTVNFYVKGVPVTQIIDDLLMMKIYWGEYIDFPFAPLLPDGAAWMIFAEKAFARANGYYYRLEGGKFGEAIRTLSGAPSREYKTSNYNSGLIFQIIMQSVAKSHIISATSQRGNTA